MILRTLTVVALFSLLGCRTQVQLGPREKTADRIGFKDAACDVHDYPAATDVPAGSTNIGWVQVPRADSDEQTYLNLRAEICAKGGNGLSQMHWVKEVGKVTGEPTALEASAWVLPAGH